MSLQFSEFNALRQRQKSTQKSTESDASSSPSPSPSQSATKSGYFFETLEVQLLTFMFIIFDVGAAIVSMPLLCEGAQESSTNMTALFNIIDALMGFTLIFFIMELLALMFTFKIRFFTHYGNLVDLVVVSICVAWEIEGKSRTIRLLGLVRVWRLLRIISTLIQKKDIEIEELNEKWNQDKELVQECRLEMVRMEDSLKREAESKRRVETMLKSYKDEVETLNEALKIAAFDIASAAADQLISDDEDEDADLSEELTGGMGSSYTKNLRSNQPSSSQSDSSKTTPASTTKQSRKLVVNADGSYDSR